MARRVTNRPTDAELAILQVLWQRGDCTVREVQDELSRRRPMGYTTVLKLLQIMVDKGLVTRDASQRTHVFTAREPQQHTQQQLVRDLITRAFRGSTRQLVMQALEAGEVSAEELAEIRKLIDQRTEEQS